MALDWYQPNGELKLMGCKAALLSFHRQGWIQLPPARRGPSHLNQVKPPQRTLEGEPQEPIQAPAGQLLPLTLEPVVPGGTSRLWNEFMDRYHYLDYSIQKGAQQRYLIQSSQGCVGAISFASPAWKTQARDNWIGWDHETRTRNLRYIVNNTRFLILPWVQSKNLASKVLGLCARQLPRDWEARYGYRPVLFETFVEQQRFQGTCYKAANWIRVGETTGRGKWEQKGEHRVRAPLPIKDIFVYPLQPNFREVLKEIP